MVRLAGRDDRDGLLDRCRELRPADPALTPVQAEPLLDALLTDPAIVLVVADVDGELAATCMLAVVPQLACGGCPFGVIEHVVTARRHRRRGVGRAVLKFALERAWERRCSKVVLLSGVQRPEAHALVESVGFRGDVERGFVARP
ncbi:MAG: GNAT family N-acetyltransferase [Burkholderiales bacterium]